MKGDGDSSDSSFCKESLKEMVSEMADSMWVLLSASLLDPRYGLKPQAWLGATLENLDVSGLAHIRPSTHIEMNLSII